MTRRPRSRRDLSCNRMAASSIQGTGAQSFLAARHTGCCATSAMAFGPASIRRRAASSAESPVLVCAARSRRAGAALASASAATSRHERRLRRPSFRGRIEARVAPAVRHEKNAESVERDCPDLPVTQTALQSTGLVLLRLRSCPHVQPRSRSRLLRAGPRSAACAREGCRGHAPSPRPARAPSRESLPPRPLSRSE